MNILIALLVMLTGVGLGAAGREAGRTRRNRRPTLLAVELPTTPPPAAGSRRRSNGSRAMGAALAVLVLFAAVAVFGPVLLLIAATGVFATRRALGVVRQRRARLEVERSTPDAIELFILLVHAGLTPVRAIRELASVAPEPTRVGFAAVVHRLDRGEPFSDALVALPERLGPATVALIDLVASADRHGSPLGPMLESLAHEARSTRRRQHEADARRLPVRLSFPLVTCTLPSFVLLAVAPALIAALSSISLSI